MSWTNQTYVYFSSHPLYIKRAEFKLTAYVKVTMCSSYPCGLHLSNTLCNGSESNFALKTDASVQSVCYLLNHQPVTSECHRSSRKFGGRTNMQKFESFMKRLVVYFKWVRFRWCLKGALHWGTQETTMNIRFWK